MYMTFAGATEAPLLIRNSIMTNSWAQSLIDLQAADHAFQASDSGSAEATIRSRLNERQLRLVQRPPPL
jgi:hypothetical protein